MVVEVQASKERKRVWNLQICFHGRATSKVLWDEMPDRSSSQKKHKVSRREEKVAGHILDITVRVLSTKF
jgi:hypothetical protein